MESRTFHATRSRGLTVSLKKYIPGVAVLALLGCEDTLVRQQTPSTLTRPDLSLEASDQVPVDSAGMMRNTILLTRAVVRERAWAVLYEGACFDEGGERVLNTILGQSELSSSIYDTAEEGAAPDENEDTQIVSSRPLRPNEPLCVVLHADTGSQRDFEFEATTPFTFAGATGLDKPRLLNDKVVAATIHAQMLPVLEVLDQGVVAADVTLELARVVSNGPGWVSVVQGSCEEAGLDAAVLGHAFVGNGISEDVGLMLDAPITQSVTMCARLHHDDPADGVFSFERIPGTESPVMITTQGADGAMVQTPVTTSFEVSFAQP